jgi:hypothetical protein
MNDHIVIKKENLFRCGNVKRLCHRLAPWVGGERASTTGCADMDGGEGPKHRGSHNSHGSVKALLKEGQGRGPSLIDKSIKDCARKTGPEIFSAFPPIFLEKGAKVRVPEPEHSKVSLVSQPVLGEPHAVKILRIEPVDLRMAIPRVARSPIDLMPVNRPEIGHNIQIMLCNITSSIRIEEPRDKLRFHY